MRKKSFFFEGKEYILYENGQVFSLTSKKFLSIFLTAGYPSITICGKDRKKKKTLYIHRLLGEHFIPNPQNKKEVNHINGNKQDFSLKNLEWVTPSENQQHAWKTGLKKSNKRLTDEEENKILFCYLKGKYSYEDLKNLLGYKSLEPVHRLLYQSAQRLGKIKELQTLTQRRWTKCK